MAKKKFTLQQELDKRKYAPPGRFINTVYHILAKFILAGKYNVKYNIIDNINDCDGPCFLIYNHLSRRDHVFFEIATYPRRISILAGHNEFFRKKFYLLFKLMKVIPKKNFTSDMPSIKAMVNVIKKGGCVCFSPEGMSSIYGTNQPIVPGTAHFFKHFNIPVYLMTIKGSYLTSNKVCIDDRPGRIDVELKKMFSAEDVRTMSENEIDDKINQAFRHDDYEWNKTERIKFKSKGRICTGLNDICYKCPKCGSEFTMVAEGDHIECTNCGNGAKMNDYYDFLPYNDECVIPVSPSKWLEWERIKVIKEIRADKNFSFSTDVEVGYLPPDKLIKENDKTSVPCGKGKITVDHDGIRFTGEKHGEKWDFELSYKNVYSLVIVNDLTYFSFYVNGEYYDFTPDTHCTGKLLLLVEEMHRLHYNVWKNFPWNDYMYEENAPETI